MAANANVFLRELQEHVERWKAALRYAPGLDDLSVSDYMHLQEALELFSARIDSLRYKLRDVDTPHEELRYPDLYREEYRNQC